MSIRANTPCDYDGICPYNAECGGSCEYWCGAEEPQDYPEEDYPEYYPEYYAETCFPEPEDSPEELAKLLVDTLLHRDPYMGFDREEMLPQTTLDLQSISGCHDIIRGLIEIIREDCGA